MIHPPALSQEKPDHRLVSLQYSHAERGTSSLHFFNVRPARKQPLYLLHVSFCCSINELPMGKRAPHDAVACGAEADVVGATLAAILRLFAWGSDGPGQEGTRRPHRLVWPDGVVGRQRRHWHTAGVAFRQNRQATFVAVALPRTIAPTRNVRVRTQAG